MNKKSTYLALPYFLWAIIFTVLPLFLVFMFAIFKKDADGYHFTTQYLYELAEKKDIILSSLLKSFKLSAIATVVCLILGYPLAYILANSKSKHKSFLTTLIILPMWMNFLLRTYALLSLMNYSVDMVSSIFEFLHLAPLELQYTENTIIIGMIYNYLPFMVLPIHSVLSKMDSRLIEAAEDLGANKIRVFTKVIFPLSIGGVISGIEMVFIPSITTFALSKMLGGGKTLLIGDMIESQFIETPNWGFGAILSVIVIFIVLLFMFLSSRFGSSDKESGGGLLG